MELTVYIKESKMIPYLRNYTAFRYVNLELYYDIQYYPIIIECNGYGSRSDPFVIENSIIFKEIELPIKSFSIINQSNIVLKNIEFDSINISDSSNILLENCIFHDDCIYSRSSNISSRNMTYNKKLAIESSNQCVCTESYIKFLRILTSENNSFNKCQIGQLYTFKDSLNNSFVENVIKKVNKKAKTIKNFSENNIIK